MTRYVQDPKTLELVPLESLRVRDEPRVRVERFKGSDGKGTPCYQVKRNHPAIDAAGVPKNSKGRAIITTAAERDRLITAFNRHEETRSGRTLAWVRETEDDNE